MMIVALNIVISNCRVNKILLIASLCCMLAVVAPKVRDYRSDASDMGRVEAWAAGMSMLTHNPLFGVGMDNFNENYSRDSHSSFVRAGSELGLIGLYVFIGLLTWSVRTLRLISNSSELKQYKMYAVGMLLYLFVFIFGSIFSTRTYDILLVIVLAFVSSLIRIIVSNNEIQVFDMFVIEMFCDKTIFLITVTVVITWKIFLIQTW